MGRGVKKKKKTHHVESKKGIELDQTMEISKDDGDGNKDDIARVSQQKSHELDELGEAKHEEELGPEGVVSVLDMPLSRRPPARGKQKRVDDEGERGKGREVEGVCAPRLLSVVPSHFR